LGAPESKVRELEPGSVDRHYEEWIFGHVPQTVHFVRFEGDRVTQVRIAALGQPIALHTENEMHGYLDPASIHEVALGDAKSAGGEDEPSRAAPSILKSGEIAQGSTQRVRLPLPSDTTQDKSAPPDKPAAQLTAAIH